MTPDHPDCLDTKENRARATELLTRSKSTLAARYGVTELAVFGSTARDTVRSMAP